MLMVLAFFVFV